jgi:hypothetical protein
MIIRCIRNTNDREKSLSSTRIHDRKMQQINSDGCGIRVLLGTSPEDHIRPQQTRFSSTELPHDSSTDSSDQILFRARVPMPYQRLWSTRQCPAVAPISVVPRTDARVLTWTTYGPSKNEMATKIDLRFPGRRIRRPAYNLPDEQSVSQSVSWSLVRLHQRIAVVK